MKRDDNNADSPRFDAFTRRSPGSDGVTEVASEQRPESSGFVPRPRLSLGMRIVAWILPVLLVLAGLGYVVLRHYVRKAMAEALPQVDGTIAVPGAQAPLFGLNASVTVVRDTHGVPHIRANSVDDLIYAQGYITAQDRLWQMEVLRRHAAGELAAILGSSLIEHDRLQRTLQIRTTADRAIAALPDDQKHWLEVYARGVNASMIAQHDHLPLEFRVLQFQPAPWTPRDSLLIGLAMFQDLSTSFPEKFGREALASHLRPELMTDLYPVGSWRDHWPAQPMPDLTAEQPEFDDIPLDESQSRMHAPSRPRTVPVNDLLAVERTLALFHTPCDSCVAGSNGWAVAGTRTASGKPMLSNDMHLTLNVPGMWYEADLDAPNPAPMAEFHVAGLTLPGTPFVIVGHNAHVAWGFTNLGADVQDLYIEHTRGTPSGAEYEAADGTWLPLQYHREIIHVRGAPDVTLDVPVTHHGDADTPVISNIFPGEKRTVSLRWVVYEPDAVTDPFYDINSAADWTSMLAAFTKFGGPAQNMMYADDQGHIGYHAVGHIPIRGDLSQPSPLAAVPTDATGPDAATHAWAGFIPFEQLPQAFDPADGVLATANSRVTPDNYPFPITLDWMAPYRTERIYKLLENMPGKPSEPRRQMKPADMLAIQTDVYSELDHLLAQKYAYAIDHTTGPLKSDKRLHQAADLLRNWNGQVDAAAQAPAIINAARAVFWQMLLVPQLAPQAAADLVKGTTLSKNLPPDVVQAADLWKSYIWGERGNVEEQIVGNRPARWLPSGYANWDDFLAAVVDHGLHDADAPHDLSKWPQGSAYPLVLVHPIFSRSTLLAGLIGQTTGPGTQPQNGDGSTIHQVGHSFGPSERLTVDLSDPDNTTLNIVLGESGNVSSPWYLDQFQAWLHGTTYPLPFTTNAVQPTITHILTLTPQ